MHGLGNDYLLVQRADLRTPLTEEQVRRLCDYHFGVGSDGVLEVVTANGNEAEVVIWNPDGSTAELSGNGTRIAARWLARRSGADTVRIRVGPREVVARMQGGLDVAMDMGPGEVVEPESLEWPARHSIHARVGGKSACGRPQEPDRESLLRWAGDRAPQPFPRAHERAAVRVDGRTTSPSECGSAERGDALVRHERSRNGRCRRHPRLCARAGHRPPGRR